ncbi:hypothetical protein [Desulfosporosinus lacus]|uniref:Pycsar effector protein domain-containing protein n=1 Tax=Desulfosporosinus lacus DSM 15449 TaxID=1121420 RepID=A0A1M5QPT9_9FIRM|nr:hypothetical protein [Desulfosporosinus lacus]SHH16115.1 hypothetical protein SAMN02746098_00329 [Desulfosporosinus lacus DSM 15449]
MDKKTQLEYLYKSLEDVQGTIRFTDSKAGALIAASGVLSVYQVPLGQAILVHFKLPITIYAICTLVVSTISIFSFISSLLIAFKSINPMTSPEKHILKDNLTANIPFYLNNIVPKQSFIDCLYERKTSHLKHSAKILFEKLKKDSISEDLLKSLIIELCKVSYIREKKIFRVYSAYRLFALGLLFLIISSWMAHSIQWI